MAARQITRRKMIKRSASTAAGVALASAAGPALGALGANERIAVGFIGTGGQACAHIDGLKQMKDVSIAALCDVDTRRRTAAAGRAGSSPKLFGDFRQLLAMKELDAVFVVTPDHWHAIPVIAALDAGKHVYFEKPCAHNIREGRAIADAAKRSGKVTLMGVQQRSSKHWQNAVARIKAGELGKISMVHAWNAWNTKEMFGNLGKAAEAAVPEGVDYDMWLGPAPQRAFSPSRFHGTWYFFWDYAGAMVSGWGVHLLDVVCWAMGSEVGSASMSGGRFVFDDARETPDTTAAVFECPGYSLTYDTRHGNAWRPNGDMDHGIEFFGDQGTLHINRSGFQIYRDQDRGSRKPVYQEGSVEDAMVAHKAHFFDCIRNGTKPSCDAETGHKSTIPCHLANISCRVGRKVRWDGKAEQIIDDPQASKLLTREYRAPWKV